MQSLQLLEDEGGLVELLSRIAGRPADEVRLRLFEEGRQLGTNVNREMRRRGLEPFDWGEGLEAFYSETDAFLFELVVWNRNRNKMFIREWVADTLARLGRSLDVLTLGDGLGFDGLRLALAGQRVRYLEVGERSRAFARALFEAAGREVPMHRSLDDVPPESLDAVVCLDVLEHVPDPPSLVAEMARRLRPGGVLLVSAPFFMQVRQFPTHLESCRRYSGSLDGLYGPAGLYPLAGRTFLDPVVVGNRPLALIGTAGDRLRVRLGAAVLSLARWWAWPHRLIGNALQRWGAREGW